MKEIIYKKSKTQRLDAFLQEEFPLIRSGLFNKLIRQNKIKINGKKAASNSKVAFKDCISLFVDDQLFLQPTAETAFLFSRSQIEILYEDCYLLVVNKPAGIAVIDDNWKNYDTLVHRVQHHFHLKNPEAPLWTPYLCHRIDTGTSGIVVIAKDVATRDFMFEMFKNKDLKKKYICVSYGIPKQTHATHEDFLTKYPQKSMVKVTSSPLSSASKKIETAVNVLDAYENYSLLEINLKTGRTHQIRAHLAYLNLPILGDSKYGINEINRTLKLKYQLLCSFYLKFGFIENSQYAYLSFKEITCPSPWFVESFYQHKI